MPAKKSAKITKASRSASRKPTKIARRKAASSGVTDDAGIPSKTTADDEAYKGIYSPEEWGWIQEKLAKADHVPKVRGGKPPVAVLLPGILGSTIGTSSDVVWMDVTEIPKGGLATLKLPEGKKHSAQGVKGMLYDFYKTTEVGLKAAGYETYLHGYDWRMPIPDLGKELASWLVKNFAGRDVCLVAHSMGGLVSRASFKHDLSKINLKRFVTVGTPIAGAASPLLVMRGLHDMALQLAKFDTCHTIQELAAIFATFPGLLGMLPQFGAANWFDLKNWPKDGGQPDAVMRHVLEVAKLAPASLGLPPKGCPYHVILGDGIATFTDLKVSGGKFLFTISYRGDGTFPHQPAVPAEAQSVHYVQQEKITNFWGKSENASEHGSLCKRIKVAEAVVSLLNSGKCNLPSTPNSPTNTWQITEQQLSEQNGVIARSRQASQRLKSRAALQQNREEWFAELMRQTSNVPDRNGASTSAVALTPSNAGNSASVSTPVDSVPEDLMEFPRVVISRGEEIAFDIELSFGDIKESQSRVILLGQIQGFEPSAAVASLDKAMSGALSQILLQRQISSGAGGAGDLTFVPTGRHPVMAELIAFLDLGQIQLLNENALAKASASAMRHMLASRFDEFTTVLLGGQNPGEPEINIPFSIKNSFIGFLQALRDDPDRERFRRIILVEHNMERLREIRQQLQNLITNDPAFAGVRVTLSGSKLPISPEVRAVTLSKTASPTPRATLSLTGRINATPHTSSFDAILQPPSESGAAIPFQTIQITQAEIDLLYIAAGVPSTERPEVAGIRSKKQLEDLIQGVSRLLPEPMLEGLEKLPNTRLELIHDAEGSRIPWEALRLPQGGCPALDGGMSRRFIGKSTTVSWPPQKTDRLRILLLINPTEDLMGAADEKVSVKSALKQNKCIEITTLEEGQVTREALIDLLNSQTFDILHYAGHSGFTRGNSAQSGLVLAGGTYFTGSDVSELGHFPGIVVFNSCESARVRRLDPTLANPKITAEIRRRDAAHSSLSIAESFLYSGVQHYIGTFWPVNDKAAMIFSTELYTGLAAGKSMGPAIRDARRKLHADHLPDWANYIHFGSSESIILEPKKTP